MKKIASLIIVLILIGGLFAYFQYNKPHRNILKEAASHELSVQDLVVEFSEDEDLAYEKYLGKVLIISGTMQSVSEEENQVLSVLLEDHDLIANCQLAASETARFWNEQVGKKTMLKGLFIGFDGLLQEVQLKECTYYNDQP